MPEVGELDEDPGTEVLDPLFAVPRARERRASTRLACAAQLVSLSAPLTLWDPSAATGPAAMIALVRFDCSVVASETLVLAGFDSTAETADRYAASRSSSCAAATLVCRDPAGGRSAPAAPCASVVV